MAHFGLKRNLPRGFGRCFLLLEESTGKGGVWVLLDINKGPRTVAATSVLEVGTTGDLN